MIDEPWNFPFLEFNDFDLTGSIPVVRPREVDGPPYEHRTSINLIALKMIQSMNLATVPRKHRLGKITGSVINLPAGVTTDINRLEVYVNGLLIDWEIHPDLQGEGVTMDSTNRQINMAIGVVNEYVLLKEY